MNLIVFLVIVIIILNFYSYKLHIDTKRIRTKILILNIGGQSILRDIHAIEYRMTTKRPEFEEWYKNLSEEV